MDSRNIVISLLSLIAFMLCYSWVLYEFSTTIINDPEEMTRYVLRMQNFKIVIFSSYAVLNSILVRYCSSKLENELLLTGTVSLSIICLQTLLHYTHILIIPTQWNLILFNGLTIAFFLVVYIEGKRNKLFEDD